MKKLALILAIVVTIQSMAIVPVDGKRVVNRWNINEERFNSDAVKLEHLNLLNGTNEGYETLREPTRLEGLVMSIRLLGEEEEAMNSEGKHPFTDVPHWADKYVAYGYKNGIVEGVNATEFGSNTTLSMRQYATMMLRVLGYRESDGDFEWEDAAESASWLYIISNQEIYQFEEYEYTFLRGDYIAMTLNTLGARIKNSKETLVERLVREGQIDEEWARVYNFIDGPMVDVDREGNVTYIPIRENWDGSQYLDYQSLISAFPKVEYIEIDYIYAGKHSRQLVYNMQYMYFYYIAADMLFDDHPIKKSKEKYQISRLKNNLNIGEIWDNPDYMGNIVLYDEDLSIIARYTERELEIIEGKGIPFDSTNNVDEERLRHEAINIGQESINNAVYIEAENIFENKATNFSDDYKRYDFDKNIWEEYGIEAGVYFSEIRNRQETFPTEENIARWTIKYAIEGFVKHRMFGDFVHKSSEKANANAVYLSYFEGEIVDHIVFFYDKDGKIVAYTYLTIEG